MAFLSLTEGKWDFYWRAWDASAPVDLLFSPQHDAAQGIWTPDGESLLYTELNPETGMDIQYVEVGDSDSQPITLLGSEYAERSPMVSRARPSVNTATSPAVWQETRVWV